MFSLFAKQRYHIFCRKNKEGKNLKVARSKNGRIMLLSKWAVWNSKKWKFIKQEEAAELLSSLGLKTPLSKMPLLGPFFRGINKLIQDIEWMKCITSFYWQEINLCLKCI